MLLSLWEYIVRDSFYCLTALAILGCSVANKPTDPTPATTGSGATSQGGTGGTAPGGGGSGACELGTLTDCLACGDACTPANVTGPACQPAGCDYGSCTPGFQDCDPSRANGCESDPATDPSNCGVCDHDCAAEPFLNVVGRDCQGGSCTWSDCSSGFGDCNAVPGDGCEEPLDSLAYCGSCLTPCVPDHVQTPMCSGGGTCSYDVCAPSYQDCDGSLASGCETSKLDPAHCGSCVQDCGAGVCLGDATCAALRPNVMVCGGSQRPVSEFFPAGHSFGILQSCTPDASTQALFVTRGQVGLSAASLQGYLSGGGIVLTEHNISDEVFGLVFGAVAQGPSFVGSCLDTIPLVVQFSPADPFWVANAWTQMAMNDTGCGYSIAGYPGVTMLAGWDAANVGLGYRDFGAGRLWLVDVDWQDQDVSAFIDVTRQLMAYMMSHRR
ncbi:MAG: hypothetical protein HY908_21965 [Myxococcales bacterium]|nr:hypothetical protein [Myxococcales bacterium]